MLCKNQQIELTIDGYASDGSGIGRDESGMAVFVAGAIKRERVRVHLIKVNKTYAVGKLLEVLSPSNDRITPTCPHTAKCGGCTFRHMSYEGECALKRQRVADAFSRIGGFSLPVDEIVPSPLETGYRNKAMFPAGTVNDRKVFGFYSAHSHRVTEVNECRLLPQETLALREKAEAWMNRFALSVYDETTGNGLIRHLYIRRGFHSGETLVCLVVTDEAVPHTQELVDTLRTVDGVVSVVLNINRKPGNTVLGAKNILLWGRETITDTLCGRSFALSPHSFYQVNTCQAEALYTIAGEKAGTGETLVDLYCGAGTIGLSLSDRFSRIIGVEIVPQAVENAKQNAMTNGVTNAHFLAGDAAAAAQTLADEGITPDVVVLDPPRKGCDAPLLDTVAQMAPVRIVYVSCDPATCARDCRILAEKGYALCSVTPVDLFPRTAHVESVVLMSRA